MKLKAGRRQAAFADQLDDSLQLMASSLRAGHSLLRAVDAVSQDAASPTAEEFARIVNETRVGRDLGDSLDEVAERMGSEDFTWVAQAIAIHREVGGNLAEVLDAVGHTIRERNADPPPGQGAVGRGQAVGDRAGRAAVRDRRVHLDDQPRATCTSSPRAPSATGCSPPPSS